MIKNNQLFSIISSKFILVLKLFKHFPIIFFVITFSCHADTIPSNNTSFNVSFDKRGIPNKVIIWNALSGGESPSNPQLLGRNTLTCLSDSDITYGACPTKPVWQEFNRRYNTSKIIQLKFCKNGGQCINLKLDAYHITLSGLGPVSTPSYFASPLSSYGNKFTYSLIKSELSLLTPGTWKATLKQNLYQWEPQVLLTTWSADITLTVTDTGTQTIFFPSSPTSSPVVNLNLNAAASPAMSTASGQNSIDMCLYDGSNSSSSRISLLFYDGVVPPPGRPDGMFSVYLDGVDKSSPANRIDYAVSVINPTTGATQTVQNGSEIIWTNTNARNILRQVSLPGVPGTSLCVPAPLTLTTPQFKLSEKSSGHYTGKLIIVYTPTTQTDY